MRLICKGLGAMAPLSLAGTVAAAIHQQVKTEDGKTVLVH